jgi:hypothetical protein
MVKRDLMAETENTNANIPQAPGRKSFSLRRISHFRPSLSACISRNMGLAISF